MVQVLYLYLSKSCDLYDTSGLLLTWPWNAVWLCSDKSRLTNSVFSLNQGPIVLHQLSKVCSAVIDLLAWHCKYIHYRDSPDNTVLISMVPGLTFYFFKWKLHGFLHLTRFLSEINISCHMKPRSSNQFLPLMTVNENNWVAKYNL